MGFSTTGSAVVVFVGLFLVGTTVFTGTMNGLETVNEARASQEQRLLRQQNADITIQNDTRIEVNALYIYANNTGAAPLSVNGTAVLIDGEYVRPDDTRIRGDDTTDVWAPGEQLRIVIVNDDYERSTAPPSRIKLVTSNGVSETIRVCRVIEQRSCS